jgi:aspartyl-tRNA(Asn)/glutamyl-tRNA(Gln) amidotransferase subunit A
LNTLVKPTLNTNNASTQLERDDSVVHAFVALAQGQHATPPTAKGQANSPIHGQFQAYVPETPLADLPLSDWRFAIKSNIAVNGLPFTAGIGAYRDRIATDDAFCVARLREAGAAIVGTVNMEEAALGAVTNNPHFGRTHNPHRVGFTPGGSSGGSGAAVAAGMVRVALGTDTMGSCRIPAAYCGVVGFKPSFGAISMRGVEPLAARLDHVGILANNIADVAATFEVISAHDALRPRPHALHEGSATVRTMRLAVLDVASQANLTAPVRAAYERALDDLRDAGCVLISQSVDQVALARARRAGLLICEAELAESLRDALANDGDGVSAHLRGLIAFAQTKSSADIAAAHRVLDEMQSVFAAQIDDVDLICWPTAPQQAFSFDGPVPTNQADFTCLANFTGVPALSIPLTTNRDLPIGLQLMMSRGRDYALLEAASNIDAHISR